MNDFYLYSEVMRIENVEDPDVAESLTSLSKNYSIEGLKLPDSVNYNNGVNRAAYMYLYAACHTHQVFNSLGDFGKCAVGEVEVDRWKTDLEELKICSIGGGPGCDIVAFLLFLKSQDFADKAICCTVVDKYEGWKPTYEKSLDVFTTARSPNYSILPKFITSDLFEAFTDELKEAIRNSDSIIMNKFTSCVANDRRLKAMLTEIVELMKEGALLIFIDNSGGTARFKMEDVAEEFKMAKLYENNHKFWIDEEQDEELKDRLGGYYSKRSVDVISIIWKKYTKTSTADSHSDSTDEGRAVST